MADGTVKIDVILSDGKVGKGIAKVDKSLGGLNGAAKKVSVSIGSIVKSLGLVALASKGIDMVTQSLSGAIDRYDTLNNFPRVMQQMGFDASESEGAINKLSDGIQGLPTTLDSVASTAQRIAILTGDLDGATDTTLALNDAFLASGASSADAERGLEQYVQMLSKGEVDLQSWRTLQETMGVALNDVAKAFGFTGKAAQNDLYAALKDGDITFEEFNNKLIELDTAQGGFAERAKTASGGIKTAYTNMKTAVVRGVTSIIESIDSVLSKTPLKSIENILEQIGNAFNDVLTLIAEGIPKAVEKIKEIHNTLEPWLPLLTSIVAGIIAFQTTISVINGVKTAINTAKIAFATLNATILANPIALVVAAIVAAAILIIAYWEPISEFFSVLWEGIKEAGLSIWESLKEAWNTSVEFLTDLWSGITEFFSNLWGNVKEIFSTTWGNIKETVSNFTTSIKENVQEKFESIKTAISNKLTGAKNAVVNKFTEMKNNAFNKAAEIKQGVQNKFTEVKQAITNKLSEAKNALVNKFVEMVSNARSKASEVVSTVKTKFTEVKQAIKQKLVEAVKTVGEKIGEMPGKVTEKASEMVTAGKDLVKGLIEGITNMGKDAVEAITGVVGGVVDKAKSLLSINSPSKLFRQFGEWTSEGLSIGIDDEAKQAFKSSKNLAKGVSDSFDSDINAGFKNRLRGLTAPINTVLPKSLHVTQSVLNKQARTNDYDDSRVVQLLKQLVDKDGNIYIEGEKLGTFTDKEQARRINLRGRRVAID